MSKNSSAHQKKFEHAVRAVAAALHYGLTIKTDKYMVVMGPSASQPPEGLHPNQVQEELSMV
jgi:hypothetical protein